MKIYFAFSYQAFSLHMENSFAALASASSHSSLIFETAEYCKASTPG